jgi:hypothetical protein
MLVAAPDDASTTGVAARPDASIIEIRGFVDYQQRPVDVNLSGWERTPFQIRVRGSNWIARLVPSDGSFDYSEVGSDGTDSYWLDCYKSVVEKARREGQKTGRNVAAANVRASPVPAFHMTHQIGAIWLSYAASFYFDHITNHVAESPATQGARNGSNRYPDVYSPQPVVFERFAPPLTLNVPKSATYFDRWLDPQEAARPLRLSAITNLPVHTVFTVEAVTNCQGVRVVLSSQLTWYARLPSGLHCHEYRVQATNVTVHPDAPLDPRPAIMGVTLFTDERFNTGNNLHFNYLEEAWLGREAVKRLPEYKHAKAQADRAERLIAHRAQFKYFLIAFVLLAGAPLSVLLWRQVRGSGARNKLPVPGRPA